MRASFSRTLLSSLNRASSTSSVNSCPSLMRPTLQCRYLTNISSPQIKSATQYPPKTSRDFLSSSRRSPFIVLRPYHVSIRTLEQRHSAATVAPPCPPESEEKEDKDKPSPTTTTRTTTSTSLDDHIQPQHQNPIPPNTDPKARMFIGFTCTVCNSRSHKTMSKHAYHHGVVIMQCDHCKNRHLIADHLGWFKTGGVTVEDLVKERGETVQKLTKCYKLVKDGEITTEASTSASNLSTEQEATTGSVKVDVQKKTELEIALEKAAEGMLEWIPKDILQLEEERMKKSQELIDHSKKQ